MKKGRGPIQHEALQRISPHHRVIVQPIKTWHSPDEELFECGPLVIQNTNPYKLLESSSDDDVMPDYGMFPFKPKWYVLIELVNFLIINAPYKPNLAFK